jgi:hypothetical protein
MSEEISTQALVEKALAEAFEEGVQQGRIDREKEAQRFFFDWDDRGNWYMIPRNQRAQWDSLRERDNADLSEFTSLPGHPRFWSFENVREIKEKP